MKLNNIHLFNTPHECQRTNTSGPVSSLKSHSATFSQDCMLHLSFVMGTSMHFSFTRINHVSPSLSVRGKLKLGTKSNIVRCLEDATEEQDDTSVDVVVLEGLAILYVLKPAAAGTFCESSAHDVSYHMCNINCVKDTYLTLCGR